MYKTFVKSTGQPNSKLQMKFISLAEKKSAVEFEKDFIH